MTCTQSRWCEDCGCCLDCDDCTETHCACGFCSGECCQDEDTEDATD